MAPISRLPRMIAGLLRPEAFPHPARNVELRETHISWVILAGEYAYKLKKPVSMGFLDFSTLEARRFDCEEEVRLNRRLCPDVYLGVVDVVEREGEYAIGSEGEPVEPAVWMRRLPERGMLPARLAKGTADSRLMIRIAKRLAAFHATAPTGTGVDEHGSLKAVRFDWEENFNQTADFVGRTIDPAQRDFIQAYVQDYLREHAALLDERARGGRIRDGHGDLHAASVCATSRDLYPFDCIEFNPRFRCADVAAEVAFLAMDLDHAGRADLARAFVDAYLRASGDGQIRDVLDFYKCYRAYVRGKVLGFRLNEPGLNQQEAERITNEARAYFVLAQAYAGGLAKPLLVVTMGLPASGKTSLARSLAARIGLVHLSSDVVRKQLAHVGVNEHHLDAFGTGLYTRAKTRRTYAVLRRQAAHWLRAGQPLVLDATFGAPAERTALRQLARRAGAHLIVFICSADDDTLRTRLSRRSNGDPDSASDARLDLWPALRAAFVEPRDLPEAVLIDTTQCPARNIDAAVRHLLSSMRQEVNIRPTRRAIRAA
jgi:uncharacterized protein